MLLLDRLETKFAQILSRIRHLTTDEEVSYRVEKRKGKLWIFFTCGNQEQSIAIPIPYEDEQGNYVVGERVKRAVGVWHHEEKEYNYWQLMSWILTGRIETAFAGVSKRSQLERMVRSLYSGSAPITFRGFQELVNGIVNKLPLAKTSMETWAKCNQVVFLDTGFEQLSPDKALSYQESMNRKYFPWTSLGLSDSAMVKPYLLKIDLRRFTPFGVKHHNVQRNLYQTLGMKGDEKAVVITKSAAALESKGIARTGWNWMTCFLDVPLNFEDQLIVDQRHMDKFTSEEQKIMCFGELSVQEGDSLTEGDLLSLEPNGKQLRYWNRSDSAVIENIKAAEIPFNGKPTKVKIVTVKTKHLFKEGIKLTNCHGNKGVVVFADCGFMFDEGRGTKQDIDIIVSAKTIGKRKNYGQVLEGLTTLLLGTEERIVVEDELAAPQEKLAASLKKKCYSENGTSVVTNQWGDFETICGWVFWGLIKNPENQLWTQDQVDAIDNRGLRTAGTKVSHIEFKALTTIFGPGNAITKEILTQQQGVEDVNELLTVLEVTKGKVVKAPTLPWSAIKPVDQRGKYFHHPADLVGTVADESMLPEGFMMQLPMLWHTFAPKNKWDEIEEQVLPLDANLNEAAKDGGTNTFISSIYVPNSILRGPWQHSAGLWGLSDLSGHLNNVVSACYEVNDNSEAQDKLFRALFRYFAYISKRLGTKNGEISTHCLSVRYSMSAKATATLGKAYLKRNHIEIHESMAAYLKLKTGDYVIVERFPCLGFMSMRTQKVVVTDDPQCKYVIRVSGNSLVSQNLDFDGDVIFIMAFHDAKAKAELAAEFHFPNKMKKQYIDEANSKKKPQLSSVSLDDLGIETFPKLTVDRQVEVVANLTGVKRGTGPVVAMSYNVMRIVEGNVGYSETEMNLAIEVILDKVANSVFSRKHSGVSLEERCKAAICTANLKEMIDMEFPESGSKKLCEIIKKEASKLGVNNLTEHYKRHQEEGRSNIINVIVRRSRPLWFATRSNLPAWRLLEHLDSKPTDLCAELFIRSQRISHNKGAKDAMQA